ncbi:hypothetical protein D3C83_153660 [compost metagenome]
MVIFGAMLILFMGLGHAGLAGLCARAARAALGLLPGRRARDEPAMARGDGP